MPSSLCQDLLPLCLGTVVFTFLEHPQLLPQCSVPDGRIAFQTAF